MGSGIQDYNDANLQNFSYVHPTVSTLLVVLLALLALLVLLVVLLVLILLRLQVDVEPLDFITGNLTGLPLNFTFYFPPGSTTTTAGKLQLNRTQSACAYSSNGFVVVGLVLAAATNASDWQSFDQLTAAVGAERAGSFEHLGTCSAAAAAAHGLAAADATAAVDFAKNGPCSAYPDVVHQYALKPVCTDGIYDGKPCGAELELAKKPKRPALNESDFYDLYDESCLNGWTMGNIASAPLELVRFYQLLASGQLISQQHVAAMQDWKYFTTAWCVARLLARLLAHPSLTSRPPTAAGRSVAVATAWAC